jgi:hypothetical protein
MTKRRAKPASTSSNARTDRADVQEFDTYDEAVAALYSQLEPGGSIAIHAEDCALVDGASDDDCDCTPMTLTSGAKA